MAVRTPRYTKEDAARLGDDIYERDIRAKVEPAHMDEIVAIDLDTGNREMDTVARTAAKRLEARFPDAQIWVARGGSRSVRFFRKYLLVENTLPCP